MRIDDSGNCNADVLLLEPWEVEELQERFDSVSVVVGVILAIEIVALAAGLVLMVSAALLLA